jgi:magnesium chelatase subunit D
MVAVAPVALGGAVIKAGPGPVRDAWLEQLRELLPEAAPWRKIPGHVSEARLLGGLDLTATLQAGYPVAQSGLLAECDGGVALLAMAERSRRVTDAHLAAVLDCGVISVAREGLTARVSSRIGVIALDEGVEDDEHTSHALRERVAFHLDLRPFGIRDVDDCHLDRRQIDAARQRLSGIGCDEAFIEALCVAAMALGIDSPRAALQALTAARVAAALREGTAVEEADLDAAVRLVLAPRATRVPAYAEEEPESPGEQEQSEAPGEDETDPGEAEPPAPEADSGTDSDEEPAGEAKVQAIEDRLIEAAAAALPPHLLSLLKHNRGSTRGPRSAGKSGALSRSFTRGRPMGTMPGDPRSGARLSLVATLRAAAPWQTLRRSQEGHGSDDPQRMIIRRDDFRVVRYRDHSQSTTIFLVDASGSAALNRLAEAKGAVELMLADCYIRRDQVALIAFRGEAAELLLPPTRSLVRAKRNLAALPGGGGTPLASALEAAAALGLQLRRRGGTPGVILLTDGRANIARDGSRGRAAAAEDLQAAVLLFRQAGLRGMLVDTSPRPHASAATLAKALDVLYLPLPHADAAQLRDAVQAVSAA